MKAEVGWQHEINPYKVDFIDKYLKPGQQVLDLGSGKGFYSFYARDKGANPTAYDQEIHFDAEGSQIPFIEGSLEDPIKAEDQSFDAVFCWDIIEHVDHESQLWQELNRVVRSGGTIFVSVPHGDYSTLAKSYLTYGHYTDKTHQREYLPEELVKTGEELNWEVKEVHLKGGDAYPYVLIHFIKNKIVKILTKIYIKILFKLGFIQLGNCHGDIYVIFRKN